MSSLVGVRVCAVSFFRVCGLKTTVNMPKRAKKNEEAVDGETGNGTGTVFLIPIKEKKLASLQITSDNINLSVTAPAKKEKKGKEPEAPILYEDPPDKTTSKDGRAANMKITSWNVDGLRAWVKKNGLDVRDHMTCALNI